MKGKRGPAYRIETERLTLRCYELSDAPALKLSVDENRAHLLPWMPWAAEAQSEQETLDLLRKFRGWFDLDQDYILGIFDRLDGSFLGGTGLHRRGESESAREIGYWIDKKREGQGLITEAVAALTRVGFEHEQLDRVEIHCATTNSRSQSVPQRLGFTREGTLSRRLKDADGQLLDATIWTMFESSYAESPCADVTMEPFDGLGRRMK